ncbi:MAG: hypothetical protein COW63_15885 [Bacteroidetes bacterium CG18_big_fil_WC_8_21_14_2_50_41_14]|nr:MAG: hypothetical protein COW63_15885 [Bacteroidetes bacterium CG18_big_fil_WC_8_21_14_2_50_41_14]PJB59411.1 MAG: hypothetical protein CO098_03555 [Bacteroidetes bacterium CG_4_9_14_3_um_filter_41_19]
MKPSLQQHIESTLTYFELFSYPLTSTEIHRFLNFACSLNDVEDQLVLMKKNGKIVCSEQGYYSRQHQPQWSVEREMGNKRAEKLLKLSSHFVRVIKRFPFVEAIAISGSLSKYYADRDADIDYFIITTTNRLWIARTLLHLYKKLTFLRGHQHYYCMNYFIDQSALEIGDKNIYTAIELVTLLPVYNQEAILKLKHQNGWFAEFLPNENLNQDERFLLPMNNGFFKSFLESFINVLWAKRLNQFFMQLTDRKWRAKWKKKSFPMDTYNQALHTSLHVSKNHPDDFQFQVLNALKNNKPLTKPPTCLR